MIVTASDTVFQASIRLKEIARPKWDETREHSLERAARRIGLTSSQAERIIRGRVKSVAYHIWLRIEREYMALERRAEVAANHELKMAQASLRRYEDDDESLAEDESAALCTAGAQADRASGAVEGESAMEVVQKIGASRYSTQRNDQ